jgi:hypothetical protein
MGEGYAGGLTVGVFESFFWWGFMGRVRREKRGQSTGKGDR